MKIKYFEDYGSFNYADTSEKTTKHYVWLEDNENKPIVIDGIKAQLQWDTEDEDDRGYFSLKDGIEYLVEQSIKHSSKWISSTDYEAQTILFIKLWNENKEKITENYVTDKVERLEKEILALQNEIKYPHDFDPDDVSIETVFSQKIKQLQTWIKSSELELEQYKEGTELYEKKKKQIEDYQSRLNKYR